MQLLYAAGFVLCGVATVCDTVVPFKMANTGLRACLQASISSAYVFGAELLPTTHRVLGLAVGNSAGRLAAMASPMVTTAALHASMGYVYASFMVATGLGLLSTLAFQRETLGEYLAGFTHEACDIGNQNGPPSTRRNIDSSPFHDQFEGLCVCAPVPFPSSTPPPFPSAHRSP